MEDTQLGPELHLVNISEFDYPLQNSLRICSFDTVNFNAFIANTLLGSRQSGEFAPIINGYRIIPLGYQRTDAGLALDELHPMKPPDSADLQTLLNCCSKFFEPLAQKGIAVQCSGGLDSTILAAILQTLGIPFTLIGLTSKRYEFRTERRVQEAAGSMSSRLDLIDHDQVLPMSALDIVPSHALPSISSLTYAAEQAMADACRQAKVGVMVSGAGGDVILGEKPPQSPADWPTHIFHDWWLRHYVYRPAGVEIAYPFADSAIVAVFWRLRAGSVEDPKKCWARQFFRDHLPPLLSTHTYKSDHWGVHTAGLLANLENIKSMHRYAYELCQLDFFQMEQLQFLLHQDLYSMNQALHLNIEARIALAVWVHSVMKGIFPQTNAELSAPRLS
jgi:hypothetical protein